jgi:hypothetical protein
LATVDYVASYQEANLSCLHLQWHLSSVKGGTHVSKVPTRLGNHVMAVTVQVQAVLCHGIWPSKLLEKGNNPPLE